MRKCLKRTILCIVSGGNDTFRTIELPGLPPAREWSGCGPQGGEWTLFAGGRWGGLALRKGEEEKVVAGAKKSFHWSWNDRGKGNALLRKIPVGFAVSTTRLPLETGCALKAYIIFPGGDSCICFSSEYLNVASYTRWIICSNVFTQDYIIVR